MFSFADFANIFILIIFSTAFIKIATTLTIFRYGLGLKGATFGLVVLVFSLVLSFFVMQPVVSPAGGWGKLVQSDKIAIDKAAKVLLPFMEQHTEPAVKESFEDLLSNRKSGKDADIAKIKSDWPFTLATFMVSELKAAFYLGLIFIIPFLLIDLLIVNILAMLDISQISAGLLALPCKLLLFHVANGWQLIAEKIIFGYL